MDITPITLARHLDKLEKDNWVKRRDDPDDRRAKNIFLTSKAEPMIEALSILGKQVRADALSGIGVKEERAFMRTLLRIHKNLSSTG